MYYIKICEVDSSNTWTETFTSYYLFRKRVIKLKYSSKLRILSRSNLID